MDEVIRRLLGRGSHESLRLGVTEECYATVDMQFFIALVQMNLDGALANRQFARAFFIAQTTGSEADDFQLTGRQKLRYLACSGLTP
jgi:hypothetical protein